ncbi:MAG: hypothetical protein ABEJ79_04685 [Halolamina sp.]
MSDPLFGPMPGGPGPFGPFALSLLIPVGVGVAIYLDARDRDTDHPLAFPVAAVVGGLVGDVVASVGVPLLVGVLYLVVRDELTETAPPAVGAGDVETGDMVLGEAVGPDETETDQAVPEASVPADNDDGGRAGDGEGGADGPAGAGSGVDADAPTEAAGDSREGDHGGPDDAAAEE